MIPVKIFQMRERLAQPALFLFYVKLLGNKFFPFLDI